MEEEATIQEEEVQDTVETGDESNTEEQNQAQKEPIRNLDGKPIAPDRFNEIITARLKRQESVFMRQLEAKEAEIATLRQQKPAGDVDLKMPNPDDYDDHDKYERDKELILEAKLEKKLEQKLEKKLTAQQQAQQQQTRQSQITANFNSAQTKFRAKVNDYDDVMTEVVGEIQKLGDKGYAIMNAIEETGNPGIAYALKDPDKLEKVLSVNSVLQLGMELAEIKRGLVKEPKKEVETTTAPKGSGGGTTPKFRKGMNAEEYVKMRRKQLNQPID